MTCLHCKRLDLRKYPQHAKVGLGTCTLDNLPGVFVVFTKATCERIEQAAEDVIAERLEFVSKLDQQRKGK